MSRVEVVTFRPEFARAYAELNYEWIENYFAIEPEDRKALVQAVIDDRIDVIATDHAPHTSEEKASSYFNAPAGLPLVPGSQRPA